MQALETAVRMDPLFVITRLDLARYYDHHGNPETAEQLFKEALEVHPDSFDGHIHYGEFLYSKVSHRLSQLLYLYTKMDRRKFKNMNKD